MRRPAASNASSSVRASGDSKAWRNGEEHHVARHAVATGRKPASQRPLLDEAERARDPQACLVGRVDPDLDAVDLTDAKCDIGQRRGRLLARDRLRAARRVASSRSRARRRQPRMEPEPPTTSVLPVEEPVDEVRPRSNLPRNWRRSSIFSSSGLGSSSAHGIHGRRWSGWSRGRLQGGASRGSQQRIVSRSVRIRYGGVAQTCRRSHSRVDGRCAARPRARVAGWSRRAAWHGFDATKLVPDARYSSAARIGSDFAFSIPLT